ncbi:MAG TPA: GNAT family N-acetyltransferase [Phenylobacterium sp.]|uniref:GNAT family N-acetyltransferase n=1 Tax=Phenylobacterium sp. TaxID=1871053 RepID=UPI002B46E6EF|nr:GNAT family N-acetyltransferase [Phenylobacterium sp.]HKR87621.1 GNAT family N-acetyltransferase [Phenylobacterium sp.]
MARGLEIRRARPEELPACADLYVKVLTETFTWLPAERHDRREFLRSARDEDIYVALEAGRILAVAGFYRPMNFIHSLYVLERGRGVGKALLDHLAGVARGPLSLKVQAANLRAQAFYAREGFVVTERGRDPGSDITWLRLTRDKPSKS